MTINEYLNNRGISDDVIKRFGIEERENGIVLIGRGIAIPIKDPAGNLLFYKYRQHPEDKDKKMWNGEPYPKYVYEKGSKATLAFYDHAKYHKDIIVCEGELDALALWSVGIPAITSTGGCATFNVEWMKRLVQHHRTITFIFDNDAPGYTALGVHIRRFIEHINNKDREAIRFSFLPKYEGVKDITDALKVFGWDELKSMLVSYKCTRYGIEAALSPLKKIPWVNASENLLSYFKDGVTDHTLGKQFPVRKKNTSDVVNDNLLRAKDYPINNLIKFNSQSKAPCIWHNDHTPSMHYYKDKNRVKCFSCGKGGDVVDVYRQLNGCTLKEAIDKLQ